jgi:hypothetical protein
MKSVDFGVAETDFGLGEEEAGFWVRAVWFTGGMGVVSEVWDELNPERQEMLARALPPNPHTVRWLDYYEDPDVCVLRSTEGPVMIGMFNLSKEPRTVGAPASHAAACSSWTEWLGGERLSLDRVSAGFPPLPPRSARIWMADA